MSLNETPQGERLHIGIFGRRNAGKSSLLNSLSAQDTALVSDVKGTTTDPVYKAMELAPLGPVLLIDTAGIDDQGELGALRVEKTKGVLRKTDLALLAVDALEGLKGEDRALIDMFESARIKHITVYNKSDLLENRHKDCFYVSCKTGENIEELKERIAAIGKAEDCERRLVADIISAGDTVVLVIPIDKAAPKGRLILPQQQTIRDILSVGAFSLVTRDSEYSALLKSLQKPPKLVITDSQVFGSIVKQTPESIALTSFSILMARYKGILEGAVRGAQFIDALNDGDKILLSEGCTHRRQCGDIGTVKLPAMIEKRIGKKPLYEFASGGFFPDDLSAYKLIIHCGACMLNAREMLYRESSARSAGIALTNYGVAMAYMQGILERCTAPFNHELHEGARLQA